MKHYLPGRVELFIFAALAIISAAIVAGFDARDAAMAFVAFPIFILAATLGLWKSGRLRGADEQS